MTHPAAGTSLPRRERRLARDTSWVAVLILLSSAVISLFWSGAKLLWFDEILEMQVDSLPTLAQVVAFHRDHQLSLDPVGYHLLAHLSMRLFGANALALRLPSLLGYLVAEACLFVFVRRLSSEATGLIAMAFPVVIPMLYYSVEGRPYGVVMGLTGLAMVAWQACGASSKEARGPALVVLAFSIAFVLNCHYYAVLLLLPLALAEAVRTARRWRVDVAVWGAFAAGAASLIFVLPFKRATTEFGQHYTSLQRVDLSLLENTYVTLLFGPDHPGLSEHHLLNILFVLGAAGVIGWCVLLLRRVPRPAPEDLTLLVSLTALPVFGYLLARFVTHALVPRYVLATVLGIAALLALSFRQIFVGGRRLRALVFVLLAGVALAGGRDVLAARRSTRKTMEMLRVTPQVQAALTSHPERPIYTANLNLFDLISTYEPSGSVRGRVAIVYSRERDVLYAHRDVFSLTALHMVYLKRYTIVPYDQLLATGGDVFLLVNPDEWDWTLPSLAAEHIRYEEIGSLAGSPLLLVHLPAHPPVSAGF